jgi:hypothetical protein
MSMPEIDDTAQLQADPVTRTRPAGSRAFRFWLALIRLSAVLQALFLVAQPVWIGQYLSGVYTLLGIHSAGGIIAVMTGFLLLFASLGYAVCGGRRWLPPVALGLVVAEILQIHAGFTRNLALHIPLGVLVIVAGVSLAAAAFTGRIAAPRSRVDDKPAPAVAAR